jgi:spore germination cell wall hydrolase CwlJ-like protein
MIAVSHVVLNRVESNKFPNNICDVVTQAKKRGGKLIRHKCQFSWYCDGLSDYPKNKEAWAQAKEVAIEAYMLHAAGWDVTDGSTFYHAKTVNPHWASAFDYVSQIDDHLFYRED